jgi:PEGA domain-containing protein
MNVLIRPLLATLLLIQVSIASPQQEIANNQAQSSAILNPASTLEDGTPVTLRISQTVSSADAHVNDRVKFEVVDEVRVADTLIIPKGGIAWGTVTEAQHKRRLGRGGKLEIVMNSVRLADGETAPLRATKEAQGGGHPGVITTGIIATGLIFWPVAPAFLFIHGKDITIPKGTEVPTFINGNLALDMAKFREPAPVQAASEAQASTSSDVAVTSNPSGADIEVDGAFVGDTPSTITITAGDHTISLKKPGFTPWERIVKVSGGRIQITAELQASGATPTQPAQ